MEFSFSEEEKLLKWSVNEFAQKELAATDLSSFNRVPQKIVEKMGALGFLGMKVAERYGGTEGTWVDVGILVEEMARRSMTVAHLIMRCYEMGAILDRYGTEKVKTNWLAELAKGRKVGCVAATEPVSGSSIADSKTHAPRNQDSYFISGEKRPVSFGMQADFGIVFAKTDAIAGSNAVSVFLVPLTLPGITRTSMGNMGLRGAALASIAFDRVRVPVEYRLGGEGEGLGIHAHVGLYSGLSQILSGIISVGASQEALDQAISYSRKRVAFGRPLAQFQAVSEKIAEDLTLVEAGRWLCYRALWLKEQQLPHAKESAMCSWWCPRIAYNVIKHALLIHGHTGYTDDLPLEAMLRDVTAFQIIGGSDPLMKLIIAYQSMGKMVVPEGRVPYLCDDGWAMG